MKAAAEDSRGRKASSGMGAAARGRQGPALSPPVKAPSSCEVAIAARSPPQALTHVWAPTAPGVGYAMIPSRSS